MLDCSRIRYTIHYFRLFSSQKASSEPNALNEKITRGNGLEKEKTIHLYPKDKSAHELTPYLRWVSKYHAFWGALLRLSKVFETRSDLCSFRENYVPLSTHPMEALHEDQQAWLSWGRKCDDGRDLGWEAESNAGPPTQSPARSLRLPGGPHCMRGLPKMRAGLQ